MSYLQAPGAATMIPGGDAEHSFQGHWSPLELALDKTFLPDPRPMPLVVGATSRKLHFLNTNDHELAIADQASSAGVIDPGLDYFRAARALSEREYNEAVAHLETARRLDPESVELAQYQIFALMLAGEASAAERAANELRRRAAPETTDGLPGFWEWYASRHERGEETEL